MKLIANGVPEIEGEISQFKIDDRDSLHIFKSHNWANVCQNFGHQIYGH